MNCCAILPCEMYLSTFNHILKYNKSINLKIFIWNKDEIDYLSLSLLENVFFVNDDKININFFNVLQKSSKYKFSMSEFNENDISQSYHHFIEKCTATNKIKIFDINTDDIKDFFLKTFNYSLNYFPASCEPLILTNLISNFEQIKKQIFKNINLSEKIYINLLNLYDTNFNKWFYTDRETKNNEIVAYDTKPKLKQNHFIKKRKKNKKHINLMNSLY